VCDIFSNFWVLIPVRKIDAVTTAEALIRYYIVPHGIMLRLHSDNGRCFIAEIWKQMCFRLNISATYSTPFFPHSNAKIENKMRSIKNALTIMTNAHKNNWTNFLYGIQIANNCTLSISTGFTPNRLFTGFEKFIPNHFLTTDAPNEIDNDIDSLVTNFSIGIHTALTNGRKTAKCHQKTMKIYYDRNTNAVNTYAPGQLVLLKNMIAQKLDKKYPHVYRVKKKLIAHSYLIERLSDRFTRKANISQLRPYFKIEDFNNVKRKNNESTQTLDANHFELEDSQITTNPPTCDLEERLQNSDFLIHNDSSIVFNENIDLPRQNASDITLQASYFKPDTF
jgi:hypothetical protein